MDVKDAAIRQANERSDREGKSMTVYHAARDQWGRDAVFYVRSDEEGPPVAETLGKYDTVYRVEKPCQCKLCRDARFCHRELKPGVDREKHIHGSHEHKLDEHVDYNSGAGAS